MALKQYAYQHANIARFAIQCGPYLFQFEDHLLVIRGDDETSDVDNKNANFLSAWSKMEPRDHNAITLVKEVENTRQLTEADVEAAQSRTVRGPVGTQHIKSPIVDQNDKIGNQPANASPIVTPVAPGPQFT